MEIILFLIIQAILYLIAFIHGFKTSRKYIEHIMINQIIESTKSKQHE